MKKIITGLLALALMLSLSCAAFAADFNAGLAIDRTEAGKISVTVENSDVLAEKKPTLTIPCDFAEAYVTFGGNVISSVLDTVKDEVSFTVAAGGTYVIISGKAPTPPAPEPPADDGKITVPVTGSDTVEVTAKVEGSSASVAVSGEELDKALGDGAGELEIDLSGLKGVDTAKLPSSVFEPAAEAGHGVTLTTENGIVAFDGDSAAGIAASAGAGAEVAVSVKNAGEKNGCPVYDLNVTVDGKPCSQFNGYVTVKLPYAPKAGEKSKYVTAWLYTDEGKYVEMTGSYDPESGCAVFKTTHFSTYVVGYFPFDDVKSGKWYYSSAVYAYSAGLFGGTGGTAFEPETNMTRGMFVTMLYKLEGRPAHSSASAYSDVTDESAWYYDAVCWAAEKGFVDGYPDGSFRPDESITREQMAALLFAYSGAADEGGAMGLAGFEDASEISAYALPAMRWACGKGLMEGSGGFLTPKGGAQRAHVAAIMQRFCEM